MRGRGKITGRGYWCPLPPAASFQKPARQHATHMPPHLNFFIPPNDEGFMVSTMGQHDTHTLPSFPSVYPPNDGVFFSCSIDDDNGVACNLHATLFDLIYPSVIRGILPAASTMGWSAAHTLSCLSSYLLRWYHVIHQAPRWTPSSTSIVAYRCFHIFHFFHLSWTFRGQSPLFLFLYKALPCHLAPQPFTFMLRLRCISSRTSTGYGPWLLS